MLARLFDPARDSDVLVDPDYWHPLGGSWAELDAHDTLQQRRRWYKRQVLEGRI